MIAGAVSGLPAPCSSAPLPASGRRGGGDAYHQTHRGCCTPAWRDMDVFLKNSCLIIDRRETSVESYPLSLVSLRQRPHGP